MGWQNICDQPMTNATIPDYHSPLGDGRHVFSTVEKPD